MTNGTGKSAALIPLSLLMLSACGGGDGGGTASFTSWSTIQPNSTVVAKGLSQEVGRVGIPSFVSTSSSANITFDAAGHWSNLVLNTPTTTVDLDFVGILAGGFLDATSSDLATTAVIADPVQFLYQYQTFGVWETLADDAVGAFSIGAPTPGSVIETINTTASFTGKLAGIYVDSDGVRNFAFSDVIVAADFGARTLDFSTTNTFIKSDLSAIGERRFDLDLSGIDLTIAATGNSFAGNLTPTTGSSLSSLSGTTSGQFYGPSAQELGGVFFLSDPSTPETYSGAYGAKLTP